jgi:hypothetical protein
MATGLATGLVTAILFVAATAGAQDDLVISGKVLPWISVEDDGTDTSVSGLVEMDIYIAKKLANDVTLTVKLDVEDSGDDGDLIEEAYVRWSRVGGPTSPFEIAFGRKEIKAGQDIKLYEFNTLVHADEQDNSIALEFGVKLGDKALLYVTDFLNRKASGTTAGNPDDNFAFQSHAMKLELAPVHGLKINLSYLNLHNEAYSADAFGSTDQAQYVMGIDYRHAGSGLRVFFEYLAMRNADGDLSGEPSYVNNYDSDTVQFGAKLDFGPDRRFGAGVSFETRKADAASGNPAIDATRVIVGLHAKVDAKNLLWAEYVIDKEDVAATKTTVFQAGVCFKF